MLACLIVIIYLELQYFPLVAGTLAAQRSCETVKYNLPRSINSANVVKCKYIVLCSFVSSWNELLHRHHLTAAVRVLHTRTCTSRIVSRIAAYGQKTDEQAVVSHF